jgi:hypothetical protein
LVVIGPYDQFVNRTLWPALATLLIVGCSTLPLHPVDRTDPRFAECGGDREALAAFPLDASDYSLHFPAMGKAPELEGASQAFAVVFGPDYEPATYGPGDPEPAADGTRYVCIYVGEPPGGTVNIYGPVDISGLRP